MFSQHLRSNLCLDSTSSSVGSLVSTSSSSSSFPHHCRTLTLAVVSSHKCCYQWSDSRPKLAVTVYDLEIHLLPWEFLAAMITLLWPTAPTYGCRLLISEADSKFLSTDPRMGISRWERPATPSGQPINNNCQVSKNNM